MPSPKINARRRSPTTLGADHRILIYPPSPGFEAYTATAADFVHALSAVRRRGGFSIFSDFCGAVVPEMAATTSGTGSTSSSSVAATPNRPGVGSFSTGTTNAGYAGQASHANAVSFGAGAGIWTFEADLQIPNLNDGTDQYIVRVGFMDGAAAAAPVDGAFFFYDQNNANWIARTTANSTATDVTTSVVASTSWVRLKVTVTDASSAVFTIDGADVATIATNIPTGAGRETGFALHIVKSAGTTARLLRCDWLLVDFATSALIRA